MNDREKKVYERILQDIRDNEKDSFNILVPTLFTKKLGSFMLIREDLVFIRELTLNLLELSIKKNENEINIRISLWYTIISIYGKCFTQNKGGMSKLDESDLKDIDNEMNEIHKEILELRHSYISHRDDTEHEKHIVYLKLPKDDVLPNPTNYIIKSSKTVSTSNEKLEKYLQLFNFLIKYTEDKIQSNAEKVNKAFLKEFDAQQLVQLRI